MHFALTTDSIGKRWDPGVSFDIRMTADGAEQEGEVDRDLPLGSLQL